MKSLRKWTCLFFGILIILWSCEDEGIDPLNNATALRNGVKWESTPIAIFVNYSNDSLVEILLSSPFEIGYTDLLSLSQVPTQRGTYEVFPNISPLPSDKLFSSYHTLQGGDVSFGNYDIDTSMTNTIIVESYDEINEIITLYFDLHFISDRDTIFEDIHFQQGKIVATIEEY